MKAFFSYSHADGEIVRSAADLVGRPNVRIDVRSFGAAEDLVTAMERAVQESSVFVLFVSRTSLASPWVTFEVNEARYFQAANRIRKILVVLLDSRISARDLPQWLTRAKFITTRAASPIARVVRELIDDITQDEQHRFFVGRASEAAELQAALVPPDGLGEAPLVIVRGLPGIGRRTLLERVARNSMSLTRCVTLRIEPGETINSVAVKIADLFEPMSTPEEARRTALEILSLNEPTAIERVVDDLRSGQALGELAVLYDEGGLLDNDGRLAAPIASVFSRLSQESELMAVAVTNRHPVLRGTPALADVPIVAVGQLSKSEVRQLLALMAKSARLELAPGDLAALVDQVRGYPPNADAVIKLATRYGIALAQGSANLDAQYIPRPLHRYLRDLRLAPTERRLLSVLARNSPLPLPVLAEFASNQDEAERALMALIEASLVVPQPGTSWYNAADPIIGYIDREYPPCTIEDYVRLASLLEDFLERTSDDGSYLDLSRLLYRSLVRSGGDTGNARALALQSDWLMLAKQFYYDRDFENSLRYSRLVLESTPRQEDAQDFAIRALIRLAEFREAEEEIQSMRLAGRLREAHYLRGFLERHRGDHRSAIRHYELALKAGRGGLAIFRDLAECHFQLGDIAEAEKYIEEAQSRQHDNPYVVNLKTQIAVARGDEPEARRLLELLDRLDDPIFAAHRRSRVELRFGDPELAYQSASRAAGISARPPAEVLATLALCEIRTGRVYEAASSIDRLEQAYKHTSAQVTGLRARIAMTEERYEDALALCSRLPDPESRIHLTLRRDALRGLLDVAPLSFAERERQEAELASVEQRLAQLGGSVDWHSDAD
jgi:tetratricopeptide (TPR) repeat protein